MSNKTNMGDSADLPKDIYLIRPCEVYKEEYTDCKRILSKVYQYYVDGTKKDCSRWLTDFDNCMKFRKTHSFEAMEAVLESERTRRAERLRLARENNVWEYRTMPPPEWSAPLNQQSSQR